MVEHVERQSRRTNGRIRAARTVRGVTTGIVAAATLAWLVLAPTSAGGRPRWATAEAVRAADGAGAADIASDGAAASIDLVHRGGIGGPTTAIAVIGPRIFFGAGDRVAVANAHADGSGGPPHELPMRFGGQVTSIATATGADGGERLWVGTGAGWLYVLRLAADGTVASSSTIRTTSYVVDSYVAPAIGAIVPLATPDGVAAGGQLGLSLYQDTGVDIVRLGLVERVAAVSDLARIGTTLYVADGTGLGIVDVSDPTRPILAARRYPRSAFLPGVPDPGDPAPATPEPFVLAVAADAAHRAVLVVGMDGAPGNDHNAWLAHLDASDPLAPREVGVMAELPLTYVSDLVVSADGRHAWLTAFDADAVFGDPFGGARAFALALDSDGRWRGADGTGGLGQGGGVGASFGASALLSDGTLVASVHDGGFERIRRVAGGQVVRAPGVALPGGIGFVEPAAERLWLLSTTPPAALSSVALSSGVPVTLGTWRDALEAPAIASRLPWDLTSVGADNDRVVVAAPEAGLFVFDASDATRPMLRGRVPNIQPFALAVRDGRAFVGLAEWMGDGSRLDAPPQTGVQVYDVRAPDRPRLVAWLTDVGDVCRMQRDADVLWLHVDDPGGGCMSTAGLVAVDVRDPVAPRPLAVRWPVRGGTFAVDGGRLVRRTDSAQFDVFDVRNPAAPRPLPGVVGAGDIIGLRGSLLFTGDTGKAEVWDLGPIDAEAAPKRLARVVVPSLNQPIMSRLDVVTRGGRLLIETDDQGLWQLDAVRRPVGRAWLPTLAR